MNVRLSTGVEYSSGKYGGAESIDEIYAPLSVHLDKGRIGIRLTVPYLEVTAPLDATLNGGDDVIVAGSGSRVTESGLGDIVGSITVYDVIDNRDLGLLLDINASIKFGTADEEVGLGTGENDYSLRFDGYKYFTNVIWQASAGYKLRGEPEAVELNDVFFGSVGSVFETTPASMIGLYYDFRQSALADADDIHELSGFVSVRINDSWDLQTYAFTGLTDSSPDWGVGLMVAANVRDLMPPTRHQQ